ncbi:MAG: hypothetical protein ACFWT0_05455 [Bifidobacterium crudilactis]
MRRRTFRHSNAQVYSTIHKKNTVMRYSSAKPIPYLRNLAVASMKRSGAEYPHMRKLLHKDGLGSQSPANTVLVKQLSPNAHAQIYRR